MNYRDKVYNRIMRSLGHYYFDSLWKHLSSKHRSFLYKNWSGIVDDYTQKIEFPSNIYNRYGASTRVKKQFFKQYKLRLKLTPVPENLK